MQMLADFRPCVALVSGAPPLSGRARRVHAAGDSGARDGALGGRGRPRGVEHGVRVSPVAALGARGHGARAGQDARFFLSWL